MSVEEAMQQAAQHFTKALEYAAKAEGLADDRIGAFMMFVGNECYEGRCPEDFMVVLHRVPDLVKKFRADEAI